VQIFSAPPVALRQSQVANNLLGEPMLPDGMPTKPDSVFLANGAVISNAVLYNKDLMDVNDLYQNFTGPQGSPLANVSVDPLGDPFNRPGAPKIVNS
jgi:hypothetical protein